VLVPAAQPRAPVAQALVLAVLLQVPAAPEPRFGPFETTVEAQASRWFRRFVAQTPRSV